jgi:hypothetical protein
MIRRKGRLVNINPWCLWFDLLNLEATFVLILSLLRPEDMVKSKGTDHHGCYEDIGDEEEDRHNTTDNLDRLAGESLTDCKSCRYECRVGEDERVPCHGEDEAVVPYNGEMSKYGDEEKEYCETGYFLLVT